MLLISTYVIVCLIIGVLTLKNDRKWKKHTTVTDIFMTMLFCFCPPFPLVMLWYLIKDLKIPQKIAKFGNKKLF